MVFLARVLGILYVMNNVDDKDIRSRVPGRLIGAAVPFLVLFVAYLVHVLLKDGFAYNDAGYIYMEPYKYLTNFIDMWYLLVVLLVGVVLVLYGIGKTIFSKGYIGGIWPAGIGTVLTVLALLLSCAWNHTAYYPSTADLQSSLTFQRVHAQHDVLGIPARALRARLHHLRLARHRQEETHQGRDPNRSRLLALHWAD